MKKKCVKIQKDEVRVNNIHAREVSQSSCSCLPLYIKGVVFANHRNRKSFLCTEFVGESQMLLLSPMENI